MPRSVDIRIRNYHEVLLGLMLRQSKCHYLFSDKINTKVYLLKCDFY